MKKAAPETIIIVKKKVGGHGKHHGGAWKVAYADFVTAMMALFIVLWLMNSTPDVKESVAGYFKDPTGASKETGKQVGGAGKAVAANPEEELSALKEGIEQVLKKIPEFHDHLGNNQVELSLTGEGLRIELLEKESGLLFDTSSAAPTSTGTKLLATLAKRLGQAPNLITIEGHTDAVPFGKDARYSNWELSADRANSARRIMEAGGLRPTQVSQVRGFAAGKLRYPNRPEDAGNRRITVLVAIDKDVKKKAKPAHA